MNATELETALLSEFHALYGARGFPRATEVEVISRENTGGGRYLGVSAPHTAAIDDGHYDLGGKFIQMQGIPHGMMAIAWVRGGQLREIEITVYGGDSWNGEERAWSLR